MSGEQPSRTPDRQRLTLPVMPVFIGQLTGIPALRDTKYMYSFCSSMSRKTARRFRWKTLVRCRLCADSRLA
jgi:hypothetical protein